MSIHTFMTEMITKQPGSSFNKHIRTQKIIKTKTLRRLQIQYPIFQSFSQLRTSLFECIWSKDSSDGNMH